MWTVIYMAQSKEILNQIRKIIEDKKIITKIRSLRKSEEDYCYELLVPASEVSAAHGCILEAEI